MFVLLCKRCGHRLTPCLSSVGIRPDFSIEKPAIPIDGFFLDGESGMVYLHPELWYGTKLNGKDRFLHGCCGFIYHPDRPNVDCENCKGEVGFIQTECSSPWYRKYDLRLAELREDPIGIFLILDILDKEPFKTGILKTVEPLIFSGQFVDAIEFFLEKSNELTQDISVHSKYLDDLLTRVLEI